jgi:hypothetical protein
MHAALQGQHSQCRDHPTAVAYDIVLEDHVLARQGVQRTQRPFSRETRRDGPLRRRVPSRAFVTFGRPIPVKGIEPVVPRSVLD